MVAHGKLTTVPSACYVAAPGSVLPGICVPRPATGTPLPFGTTTSVCVWLGHNEVFDLGFFTSYAFRAALSLPAYADCTGKVVAVVEATR